MNIKYAVLDRVRGTPSMNYNQVSQFNRLSRQRCELTLETANTAKKTFQNTRNIIVNSMCALEESPLIESGRLTVQVM